MGLNFPEGDDALGDVRTDSLPEVLERLRVEQARRACAEQALEAALLEVASREQALRAAEELAQLGSWAWDVGSTSVRWSAQVHHIFGTDPERPGPEYETYIAMLHPDDRDRVVEVFRAAVRDGVPCEVDHRIVRSDGQVREIRARGLVEFDANGSAVRLTGSLQDVTDARAAAHELQRSGDLFAAVLDAATEQSIIATDPEGIITVFNTGAERMLGYRASEMIGTSPERLHDPGEIQARAAELNIAPGFRVFLAEAARGRPETRQWTYVTRDGRRLQASITVTAMRGPAGAITGYIKVGTDITRQLQAQAALQDSELRFRDTFRHAPSGMMLIGLDGQNTGRMLQVNPALCQLTGYSEDQLVGMTVAELTAPEDVDAHYRRFADLRDGRPAARAAERHWIHADGHDLWVQFSVSPRNAVADSYVVGQVEDISARKHAEARLTHQSLHDPLTGLPNRLLLMDRIAHALRATSRSHSYVGVLFMDLDGFKEVNDSAGHAAGDQILVEVANRIRPTIRPGDTVARWGGDEFVMVCERLRSADVATHIAERILAAVGAPSVIGEHRFTLTASIGVALSDAGSDPEQILRKADQAMYEAKRAGKGRIQLAAPMMPPSPNGQP